MKTRSENPMCFPKHLLGILVILAFFSACLPVRPTVDEKSEIVPSLTPSIQPPPTEHVVELATQPAAILASPTPLDFAATVGALKEKILAQFVVPGWIWVRTEYQIQEKRAFVPKLPNGMDKPAHYLEESWFHVNEKQLVDQYLITTLSPDHQVLMTEIFYEGVSYSPLVNVPVQLDPWPVTLFDNGLLDRVSTAGPAGSYQIAYVELNGNRVIKITSSEKNPLFGEDVNEKVKEAVIETYFDALEGWKVQEDTIYILGDGSSILASSHLFEIRAGLTPPNEAIRQMEEAGK